MATELLKTDEVRSWTPAKIIEAETDIRRQLATLKMDIYKAPQMQVGNVRKLKVNLARILTVKNDNRKASAKKTRS